MYVYRTIMTVLVFGLLGGSACAMSASTRTSPEPQVKPEVRKFYQEIVSTVVFELQQKTQNIKTNKLKKDLLSVLLKLRNNPDYTTLHTQILDVIQAMLSTKKVTSDVIQTIKGAVITKHLEALGF